MRVTSYKLQVAGYKLQVAGTVGYSKHIGISRFVGTATVPSGNIRQV